MRLILAIVVCLTFADTPLRAGDPSLFHFETQIAPLLSRYNCNSSGCHGKAEGQGGFKLSVFGFDPELDHATITREGRGRRVMYSAPDESMFLRKATGRTPHGGGTRIKFGSEDYVTLRDWIAGGSPMGNPDAPRVVSIRVEPSEKLLGLLTSTRMKVVAKYSNDKEVDVTRHVKYQTNRENIATVDADGVIRTTDVPGEAAVMASYLGHVDLCRVIVPRPGDKVKNALPQWNAIDKQVDNKLTKLNIEPSGVCDDADYIRRVYLDLVGMLPEPDRVRKFLASTDKDKRAKLVDELLTKPEYADLMALRWADLLRVNRQVLGHQNANAYYRWIRENFRKNVAFDQFTRDLMTAEGPLNETHAANFFKVASKPGDAASTLSQVFLGVRIACAECHHHPTDRWSQTDYFGMVAFFTPVSVRGAGKDRENDTLIVSGDPVTKHPRSGKVVPATPLTPLPSTDPFAGRASDGPKDRRLVLASWMTDPANPFFARNYANRLWAFLFGRGIVEPVDDVRATNPPSNPELLDTLAKYAIESKYDTKAMIRFICASRVYQSSSTPTSSNEKDEQNFSRALMRRPGAEVLHDMIAQVTGIRDKFSGMPTGTRAVQVWDSETKHEFLKLFGRPSRVTACECERNSEPSTAQVLNLLNSPELQRKLSHENGAIAKWVDQHKDEDKLVEEVYLSIFTRMPTEKERTRTVGYVKSKPDRRQAVEDLVWAMLNSLEFQFNH